MNAAALSRIAAREESRRTSFVGMAMALGSWSMLFASLFFSYAVLRLRAETWPPLGVAPLPKLLPFLNTLVLLASSAVLALGTRRGARPGALVPALRRTLALGALFLALQLAVWVPLWRAGFRMDNTGAYGSLFYGLTVFHALHVLAGLAALLALVPGAARGRWASGAQSRVRLTAMFWHFVDAVWVLMFVTIYLL